MNDLDLSDDWLIHDLGFFQTSDQFPPERPGVVATGPFSKRLSR